MSGDGADELVTVSRGPGTEIVELVRRAIAGWPARRAEPCAGLCDERSLEDAVVVEWPRERAQPWR